MVAVVQQRGIDILTPNADGDLLRAIALKDASGAKVTSGSIRYYLYRVASDGSLESWGALSTTWKTVAAGGLGLAGQPTHRQIDGGAGGSDENSGVWTVSLQSLLDNNALEVGRLYIEQTTNANAFPFAQERMWIWGGHRGIDVVAPDAAGLLWRVVSLKDSNGTIVTTGSTDYRLLRLTSSATLEIFDWSNLQWNTTGTAVGDVTLSMTHQQAVQFSGAANTGIWTGSIQAATPHLDVGRTYIEQVRNPNAFPEYQERIFQYRGYQGFGA